MVKEEGGQNDLIEQMKMTRILTDMGRFGRPAGPQDVYSLAVPPRGGARVCQGMGAVRIEAVRGRDYKGQEGGVECVSCPCITWHGSHPYQPAG